MTRRRTLALGLVLAALVTPLVAVPSLRWRTQIVLLKATGRLPEVDWSDLAVLLTRSGGHSLRRVTLGYGIHTVISNPYGGAKDVAAGKALFAERCASCHGLNATGGHGPDLTLLALKHGSSDWALYRTVSKGVPGTAMRPQDLSRRQVWQIVGHLQAVRGRGTEQKPLGQVVLEPVTDERLRGAARDPSEWLTYAGTYGGTRYRELAAINRANVRGLRPRWIYQLSSQEDKQQSSPLVVGNTMFVTQSPSDVVALDVETGAPKWTYTRDVPDDLRLCCGMPNRGLAALGRVLYLGTLDAHLVALNADDGQVLWDVEVGDYRDGYTITSAPLVALDRVIVGVGGGDYGSRGFIAAFDPRTGERRWRFYTVPEPGQPGGETWTGDAWKHGGGAPWFTGSFDPESGLLYWGVGNPGPNFGGDSRPGDNLYTSSVVALDAASGRLKWHFQFTPHDEYDWDAAQTPMLVDAVFQQRPRKLLLWANKNAFYYVLDRTTGEFLLATPFARQTWASGVDSTGRPIRRPEAEPTAAGTLVFPGANGATSWWSPSYSPRTGLVYIPVLDELGAHYFKGTSAKWRSGEQYLSGATSLATQPHTLVRALDAVTGQRRWDYAFEGPLGPGSTRWVGGVMSTAGDLVFAGAGQLFVALDAMDGRLLWQFNTGGMVRAAPITFTVGGKQYVTLTAGRSVLTFSLE